MRRRHIRERSQGEIDRELEEVREQIDVQTELLDDILDQQQSLRDEQQIGVEQLNELPRGGDVEKLEDDLELAKELTKGNERLSREIEKLATQRQRVEREMDRLKTKVERLRDEVATESD